MKRRGPARAAALAGLLSAGLLGCPTVSPVPGDVRVGTFDFSTALTEPGCPFADGGMPESFVGTVSLETGSGRAFLTVGEASHEGEFDGDRLVLSASASRTLAEPCLCDCTVVERIEARLYDELEARALGGCTGGVPDRPADAGGAGADAGPDGGLDIRLVCGTIRTDFTQLEGEACACEPCAEVFSLSGWRQ